MSSRLTNKKTFIVILCVILPLLGVGSWYLLDVSVRNVLLYKSPYTFQAQAGPGSQPLSERLLLVVVDGLESESAENMVAIRDIANRGVAARFQESCGLAHIPAMTVLMTGAPPEISGVVTNWHNTGVMIDSLWSSASRAGLNTTIVGDSKWKPLFGDVVTRGVYRQADAKLSNTDINDSILKDAIIEIEQGESQLILVGFLPERRLPHSLPGTTPEDISREEALANIDMRLRNLLETVDLGSSTVIVVLGPSYLKENILADFSANTGGACLVAAGAGIVAPDSPPSAIQWVFLNPEDIAPTCASLLGISIPTHSQGEVMFGLLDMPQHTRSEVAIRQTAQRAGFALQYMNALGKETNEDWSQMDAFLLHNDGDYQGAYETAQNVDAKIVSALKKTRSDLVASSRPVSVPILLVVCGLLVCIMAMLLWDNLKNVPIAIGGVLCYFTAYYGLLLIKGTPLSSKIILHRPELTGFYHGRIIDSIISLAFTAAVIGWLVSGRKEDAKSREGFFYGLVTLCFIVFALLAQIGVFIVTEGFAYNFYLPDMQKGFKCFMYLIQLMTAGILSPILAGLSEGVCILASQVGLSRYGQHERLGEQ